MTLKEYQEGTCSMYEKYPLEFGSFYTSLAIVKSVGILSDQLLSVLQNEEATITKEDKAIFKHILSEILINTSVTANNLGIDLEDIGEYSISKLITDRKQEEIKKGGIFGKRL